MRARILLAEDDRDLRNCLAEVLTYEGHELLPAASGQEAISILEAQGDRKVDIVISDHYMRNGSGIDLLKYVRERDPAEPAFFLVTGQSEMTGTRARALGAQEFILKPFDIPELLSLIERYTEQKAWAADENPAGRG